MGARSMADDQISAAGLRSRRWRAGAGSGYNKEYQARRYATDPAYAERKRVAAAEWRKRNPDKVVNGWRLKKYGITSEQYASLMAAQDGRCAICRLPERATFRGSVKALAVDHNHETGIVRGLLCASCNTSVSYAEFIPPNAVDVAMYLGVHQ